jgi:TetR/AcrR family transcriptional repressor of mexJK operon
MIYTGVYKLKIGKGEKRVLVPHNHQHVLERGRRSGPEERERRLALLLEAAAKVFLRMGYDGTSMELVAAEAGVTRKTVYNYFSGKDALFAAVVDSLCSKIVATFDEADLQRGTVEDRLAGFCKAIVGFLIAPPGLEIYRLIVGVTRRFPALAKTLRDSAEEAITAGLTRHLDEEVAAGALSIPDTRRAAYILIGMSIGLVQRAMLGEKLRADTADTRAYIHEAVAMFCMRYRVEGARPAAARQHRKGSASRSKSA